MRAVAVTRLLVCSLLAVVAACDDGGGDPPVAPDAGPPDTPDARSPDAMAPEVPPDAMAPEVPPDAAPPAPELVLSIQAVSADEGEPAGATFTVALSEAPGRTVMVSVTSSDETVAVVDQATLVFTDDDYDVGQSVRVTAVDDADVADDLATVTLSGDGLPEATVAVTVVDDDTVTIVAEPTALLVDEGGTAAFTVRLGAQPGVDVTVDIASSDPGAASVDPVTLTFTPGNYAEPQTVTVTGVDDADVANEVATVTLSAPGLTDVTIGVGVADDDTLRIVASSDSVSVDERGTAQLTVRLSNDPQATVVVSVASSDASTAQVAPDTLRFDSATYDTPQTVTVTGVTDDDLADEAATITLSATDAAGAPVTTSVTASVTDTTQPPYAVDMFVRGSFNAFDVDDPLVFEGGVRYTARIPLEAGLYEFKIADATFAAEFTFSADAAGPALIALGQPTTLERAAGTFNNTLLDVVQPGEYVFELVVPDLAAPVLTVTLDRAAPFTAAMFVRGSFNQFGVANRMTYEGGTRYTAEFVLDQAVHSFKIADALFTDTTTFSASVTGQVEIALDTPTPLSVAPGFGNDTLLTVTQPGVYRFDLDAADPAAPVLTVTLARAAPFAVDMFVRGSFNAFGLDSPLVFEGGARYTALIALDAGIVHELKIADATFAGDFTFSVSQAGPAFIGVGTPTPLQRAPGVSNNTLLEVTLSGVYLFELLASDPAAPVLTITLQ
jgi:hypothetical protein